MSKFTRWAWFRNFLVTANADGSIPINAKVIMECAHEVDATLKHDATPRLIAAAPELFQLLDDITDVSGFCSCTTSNHDRARALLARINGE